ncbi:MAG TPA: response regulator [Chthoniobacterales bacterium]|jgi:two-component system response regulator FixJ|nr:response regulator [Chthoniobacterales bacterium]
MKAHSQSKEPRTVLVVDDDSRLLRSIARLIRSAGVNALTFDRPAHLLASEVPETNACLLLDVHMPEMNGVQLYEMLAVTRHDLPVIMMTGRDDTQTRHLLQRVSAVAVLIKPFDESLLLDAISRALALSRNGQRG